MNLYKCRHGCIMFEAPRLRSCPYCKCAKSQVDEVSEYDLLKSEFDNKIAILQDTCKHKKSVMCRDWWGRWERPMCANCGKFTEVKTMKKKKVDKNFLVINLGVLTDKQKDALDNILKALKIPFVIEGGKNETGNR